MNRTLTRFVVAAAASIATLALSPARAAEPDLLKVLVKDEARICADVPRDRNIDAVTAYKMTAAGKAALVDVRTVQEYQLVGHVPGAYSIPAFTWGKWDDAKKSFGVEANPEFVKQFSATFPDRSAAVIVMCRSGHRSGKAIKLLAAAGYTNLYQMWEGFEGIAVADKDLPSHGRKIVDGWRNKGLPSTWDMDPKLVVMR